MSSSLDRTSLTSLAHVQYDDNDSGHYEAVVPYEPGNLGDMEGYYESPQYIMPNMKIQRSNSEIIEGSRHPSFLSRRSISVNENESLEPNDKTIQHIRRIPRQDPHAKMVDFKTDLSALIAENAAELAKHFQRKDDKQMENPRRGFDNEFLDESYKVNEDNFEPSSFLAQIQRRRSTMKYVAKHK